MTAQPSDPRKFHRNVALDGFRGLGCLLVMLGHTQWQGGTILPGALIAMDMFFVLSGFLIGGLLLSELDKTGTISLPTFWKRRAIRLLPAFYVYFSFVAIVYAFSRFDPILGTDASVSLWSTAFYASNWAVAKGFDLGVFFVTWSLSLEEQFYLLCPVLFLSLLSVFDKKKVLWVFAAAVVALNLHRYFLYRELIESQGILLAFKQVFYRLDTRSDALLIGCLGAVFYNLYGNRIRIGAFWGTLAPVTILATIFLVRDMPVAFKRAETSFFTEFMVAGGFTFFSLLGLALTLHMVQFPESRVSKAFSNRFLVTVGVMSYSIYLWHTTVFGGLDILLKSFNASLPLWLLKTAIRFAVAFLLGYVSFRFVEGPTLRYLLKKRKYASIPQSNPKPVLVPKGVDACKESV